ncbi:hypothetical protein BH10ACT1_BH10ACT1_13330 [soil metagenome]
MGTADERDVEEHPTKGQPDPSRPDEEEVSDEGGDSDPGAATGEDQAAKNRDRESPS